MQPWRVARSLDHLLAQINAAHPDRSKAADGSIGDAAHAASVSDHNPDRYGIVRARDYTHDPAHGFDAHAMADQIVASHDPRIAYVISRGRIASSTISPWRWRTYTGSNPHNHHAHVSVVSDQRADQITDWEIGDTEMTAAQYDQIRKDIGYARDQIRADLAKNQAQLRKDIGYARDQQLAAAKALGAGISPAVEQAVEAALAGVVVIDGDVTVTPTPEVVP